MRDLIQDFRYAARLLLRSPGFTFVAVAALALGIGANTAIFSVVDTLLLRPLPYADAGRLAVVWEHNLPRDKKDNVVSPGNFIHWRELNHSFKELSAVSMTFRTTLTGAGDPTELPVQYISWTLFGVLGVRPALGRDFTPQEDAPGVAAVGIYGVIGYSVSQRTQEIGIRMALGAPRANVLRMVVGQAMALAAIGVGVGAVGAWLLTRLMQKLLFGVTASDPLTFAAVSALLALVAALAASVPGLRATRVDPLIALRSE